MRPFTENGLFTPAAVHVSSKTSDCLVSGSLTAIFSFYFRTGKNSAWNTEQQRLVLSPLIFGGY